MTYPNVFWGRWSRERGLQWRGVGWVGTRDGHGGSAKDDWDGRLTLTEGGDFGKIDLKHQA